MDRMNPATRTISALVVAGAALIALLVWAGHHSPAYASIGFSKGGVSITVSVTCPTTGTTVTELSHSGGNPGFAARVRQKNGSSWNQGPEVSGTGSKSTASLTAPEAPASGHGVRVFWASGAQNYTFC